MSTKPELAFDVCWEVYRACREILESKETEYSETPNPLRRSDRRPRLNEYVADFALAGQSALTGDEMSSRLVQFRLYGLGLAPVENAKHFLGLSQRSWDEWWNEVRRKVGAEVLSRGMFPPKQYFGIE